MQKYEHVIQYALKKKIDLGFSTKHVKVEHLDGSTFSFYNGAIELLDRYVIVYSEHQQPMVFFKEDLKSYKGRKLK